jgi:LuxR family transcriptional regulator
MPCEITGHLARVLEATSIEDIWAMHCKKMAEYGFDRLLYGFTRFRTRDSFGHTDDILVLSNHSQSYFDAFIKSGLFNDAPMVRWAAANVGACSWRRIEEMLASHDLTESDRRIIAINHAHEVRAGYSISFPDTSVRAKGAIGLCAKFGIRQHQVDNLWEEHGHDILLINNVTHLKITALPFTLAHRSLTPRQREALEWVGDGKTMQDIATIMGLTPATVEKHLRLARASLDVETTAQAVLKASFQNQIFVVSS